MKRVKSIIWRKLNQASIDTLRNVSKGQYDIRLGSQDFNNFFNVFARQNFTDKDGYEYKVVLQPYTDSDPLKSISQKELTVKYMGDTSRRKDWNIPSQRPSSAYPLWSVQRRLPTNGDLHSSYICIIRTVEDEYHGRLILEDEINNLPVLLKDKFEKSEIGLADFNTTSSSQAGEIYEELMRNFNVLLYGPPGTGKTTLMQEVAEVFHSGGILYFDSSKEINPFPKRFSSINKTQSIWTTFHQSYSYEEFILGLSTENNDKSLLNIKPKPGILLELSEFSREKGNSSLLIIDELNRGNVSRIFGEFITLIEPDKRLDEDNNMTSETVKINLPYVKYGEELNFENENGKYKFTNPYTMPKNVYVLASMNSVDKSIFPLDNALRRRFLRYDIMPDLGLLANELKINEKKIDNPNTNIITNYEVIDIKKLAWKLLDYLNRKITMFLGNDYTLGHSYLWSLVREFNNVDEAVYELYQAFTKRIYPQLEELFRGRLDILAHILKIEELSISPFNIIKPSHTEEEYGAIKTFILSSEKFNKTNIIDIIQWFQLISEISLIDIATVGASSFSANSNFTGQNFANEGDDDE